MADPSPEALIERARAHRNAGALAEAIMYQEQAVTALRRNGESARYFHALRHLADMVSDSGDAQAAGPLYREILDHYAHAATLDAANAVRGAALNAERLGRRDEARTLWQDVRGRYAALDALLAGNDGTNPGVAEAQVHLKLLAKRC